MENLQNARRTRHEHQMTKPSDSEDEDSKIKLLKAYGTVVGYTCVAVI